LPEFSFNKKQAWSFSKTTICSLLTTQQRTSPSEAGQSYINCQCQTPTGIIKRTHSFFAFKLSSVSHVQYLPPLRSYQADKKQTNLSGCRL